MAICTAVVIARCIGRWLYWHTFKVSVQIVTQLDGLDCLRHFIWSRASGLMRFRDVSDTECASTFCENLVMVDGDPGNDYKSVREKNMNRTRKVQTHRERKSKDRWRAKWRACSSLFFDIKASVHKEFVLAGQTVNSAYYCDDFTVTAWKCAKTSPRTSATKLLAVASRQCTVSHSFFDRGFLTKYNMTVVRHPPYFSLFLRLEIKLKGRKFLRNWGDRGRIAGCAEHSHRTWLSGWIWKNGSRAGNGAHARKGTTSRVIVASRPKVSLRPDGSTSSGNYGWLFVLYRTEDRIRLRTEWNRRINTYLNCWAEIN
jgi:hypothetical protein